MIANGFSPIQKKVKLSLFSMPVMADGNNSGSKQRSTVFVVVIMSPVEVGDRRPFQKCGLAAFMKHHSPSRQRPHQRVVERKKKIALKEQTRTHLKAFLFFAVSLETMVLL